MRGNRSMERADNSLQRGESMQGEDHQRDAAQHIRDAQERMEQQWAGCSHAAFGTANAERFIGDKPHLAATLVMAMAIIWTRGILFSCTGGFQTLEEYRRALLEGMQADVPEEYRSLNQRYFEELVHNEARH